MVFTPIALFVFLCGLMAVAIAAYAWYHRFNVGAPAFTGFMLSLGVYILGYSLELASREINAMLFWSKVEYLGILAFPALYLIFSIQYSGHGSWLSRWKIMLLFMVPAVLIGIKLFDDRLRVIYASVWVDTNGEIPLLAFTRGPVYLFMAGYNLLVVTVGNYLVWQKRRFASTLYRQQSTIILLGAVVIYATYLAYLAGFEPLPTLKHLDLTPFVYVFWGAAIGLAIFRYRLFDLAPVARDVLIEMLNDGVVVLDAQYRMVDANPEALKIFGWSQPPVGESFERHLGAWVNRKLLESVENSSKIEIHIDRGGSPIYYEVTITRLKEKRGKRVGTLIVVHDISRRKAFEEQLHEMSLVDDLTGLANRRGFRILAGQLISMANRMEHHATLFYIDLDRLKWINDNLGHATGDEALRDTALILRGTFRTSDIIARYGGDEFVILALEGTENSGEKMQLRLLQQLDTHNLASKNYQLSFSIGLAHYHWNDPRPMESLLEEADKAMYVNKLAKRGQVEFISSPSLDT